MDVLMKIGDKVKGGKITPAPQRVLTKKITPFREEFSQKAAQMSLTLRNFFYFLEIILVLKVSRLFTVIFLKYVVQNLYFCKKKP